MKKFLFVLICAVMSCNAFGVSAGESCANGNGVWWYWQQPGKLRENWDDYTCTRKCGSGSSSCDLCVDSSSISDAGIYVCMLSGKDCGQMYDFVAVQTGWTKQDGGILWTGEERDSYLHAMIKGECEWQTNYSYYRCEYRYTEISRTCAQYYYGNPYSGCQSCRYLDLPTTIYEGTDKNKNTPATFEGGTGSDSTSCYLPGGVEYHDNKGVFTYRTACHYGD